MKIDGSNLTRLAALPGCMASRRVLKSEHGSSSLFSADQPFVFIDVKGDYALDIDECACLK